MASRIPETQHKFNEFIQGVAKYLPVTRTGEPLPRGEMLGLTPQNITDLIGADWFGKWFTGNPASPGLWEIHTNAYSASYNSKNNKDIRDFMKDFRPFFQPKLNKMAASEELNNADRIVLHIKKRDATPTFHPVPDDRAVQGEVHKVLKLQHNILLQDPANPDTREQPEGVKATRIYRAIKDQGAVPADSDFVLVGDTTTHRYVSKFQPAQVGKRAHYYGVWIDSKRNEGIKGNTFSETII